MSRFPAPEAFRIEYWALEEAKLRRMPPEAEFSRRILLVVGGGSGIGREVALLLAAKGAHVVVADQNGDAAKSVASEVAALSSSDFAAHIAVDIASTPCIAAAARFTVLRFGGLDGIINTAAIFPVGGNGGKLTEAQWSKTFLVNVTGNYLLAQELGWVFHDQQLPAVIVLTSSANAVVPKHGSEAYDASKAAVNHLVRELAIGLVAVGAGQWHCTGDGRGGFHHVSARSSDSTPCGNMRSSLTEAESTEELRAQTGELLRAAHLDAPGRFCRAIAPTPLSGWRATRAQKRPATSFQWTVACRKRSSARDL